MSIFSKSISLSLAVVLAGCGATSLVSTPIQNIDSNPLKITGLTQAEKENWGHLDLVADTIPGMSVDKAYNEIIKGKKGQKVIVAILDSGMDLTHEDLKGVLWTNKAETPGNGKDDDGNGYVDDVHGYDFLGSSYNEQLEAARMVRLNIGDAKTQEKAKAKINMDIEKYRSYKVQLDQMYPAIENAHNSIAKNLGKENYTKEEVAAIKTNDPALLQSKAIVGQMLDYGDSIPKVLEDIKEDRKGLEERLDYNLKVDYDGRTSVGDDPYDLNDRGYGDGNPQNDYSTESHGTHVAGIVAAERNNGKGANGVANNVALMSIRAVPNGDEYDKDIALGIRYAVDNGAKIINASFGKSFSPNAEWVYDAIKYAASKDVLIVHAAGNDGIDIDNIDNPNFPNDHRFGETEISDNLIEVGALSPKYGSQMVASFSNYGKRNVDVFAPGGKIYSTVPGNKYEFNSGTSMAAPAVAGVAALIRSQYPKLSAVQVKKIIMRSGLAPTAEVVVGGDTSNTAAFDEIAKSGKIVNAYNALIMADAVSAGKITL